METTGNTNQVQGGINFDLKLILKLSGILAVIFLLFMPVAGCKGTDAGNISGLDLLTKSKDLDIIVKIFFILSLLCAVVLFFMKKYIHLAIVAFSGIVTFLISFIVASGKSDFKVIELKAGAYLAILVYLAIGVISMIKKTTESESQMAPNVIPQNPYPQQNQYIQQPPQNYQQVQPQYQTPPVVNSTQDLGTQPAFRPKFCPKCGNKFVENFTGKFCTSCGNKIA